VILSALLALFLGALDTLIMGAAMPTIVSDLGGIELYSWVFSVYLLSRAVSLPIFGKLCDLFNSKTLYLVSLVIFLIGSICAGISYSMTQLTFFRAIQGLGSGGNFALAYIVLADISPLEKRGKMMSLISFVWGVSSVLGPTIGGFIVNYFSWRWIFFINVPLGIIALVGIGVYLEETREKKKGAAIDYLGALTLSTTILALLTAFLLGGSSYPWMSPPIIGLFILTLGSGAIFNFIERRAKEPILPISFFKIRGFSMGNASAFLASFAIFSLSAFSPLFIQDALGKTPAQLGLAMVPLSLGWSMGALFCGQVVHLLKERPAALLGAVLLLAGCGLTLTFSVATSLAECSAVLAVAGLGMGFISISTLLIVQSSLPLEDLGIATASQQFSRTLGGTVGIGISGSLVTARLQESIQTLISPDVLDKIIPSFSTHLQQGIENIFRPEVQSLLAPNIQKALRESVAQGVSLVFWASLITALLCLFFSFRLPKGMDHSKKKGEQLNHE
jgi:EmrB/QacA subfamily drug resistance transporter